MFDYNCPDENNSCDSCLFKPVGSSRLPEPEKSLSTESSNEDLSVRDCQIASKIKDGVQCLRCFLENWNNRLVCLHTGTLRENDNEFSCNKCVFKSRDFSQFRQHVMLSHGAEYNAIKYISENPFSCTECSYTCSKLSDFNKHMEFDHGGRRFRCQKCPYQCSSHNLFQRHGNTCLKKVCKKAKPFQRRPRPLPAAKPRGSYTYAFKKIFPIKDKFFCELDSCKFQGSTDSILKRHKMFCHRSRNIKHECKKCMFFCYNNESRFEFHERRSHAKGGNFSLDLSKFKPVLYCSECSFKSSNEVLIKKHVMTFHSTEASVSSDPSVSKNVADSERKTRVEISLARRKKGDIFSCTACQFATKKEDLLMKHYDVCHSTENKSFVCAHCSLEFKNRSLLVRHIVNSHDTGIKKFSCEACPFSTFNQSFYKYHCHASHRQYILFNNDPNWANEYERKQDAQVST